MELYEEKVGVNCSLRKKYLSYIYVIILSFIVIYQSYSYSYASEPGIKGDYNLLQEDGYTEPVASLASKDDKVLAPHIKWLKERREIYKKNRSKVHRLSRMKRQHIVLPAQQ